MAILMNAKVEDEYVGGTGLSANLPNEASVALRAPISYLEEAP